MDAKLSRKQSSSFIKLIVIAALAMAVGAVLHMKQKPVPAQSGAPDKVQTDEEPAARAPAALPRLVDLGSNKCQSCLAMMPVLEALASGYAGQLEVLFIDVWEKPDEADRYGIHLIPTQIFFDADGNELFRHEGFFSREDILAKWKELGFRFDG